MDAQSNHTKIEQINDMWAKDCRIHLDRLAEETDRHQSLQAKYLDLITVEKRELRRIDFMYQKFRFELTRFYRDGAMDREMMEVAKSRNWPIPHGKPPLNEVKFWVDTNPDMIELATQLAEQNDVIDLIRDILTQLNGRGYNINSAIKLTIHQNGG